MEETRRGKEREKTVRGKMAEILSIVALFSFQIFGTYFAVKLMVICGILCVQSVVQKSFDLVEQNLNFRN